MRVKFIETVNISNQIIICAGEEYEAREDGDFIMIRMHDDSTVKAPKYEIGFIFDIIQE